MAMDFVAGDSHADIGARYGMHPDSVGRRLRKLRREGPRPGDKALRQTAEYWARTEAAIEDLALARIEAQDARQEVAAIRAQASIMARRVSVLGALGLVPLGPRQIAQIRCDTAREIERAVRDEASHAGLDASMREWLAGTLRQVAESLGT